MRKGFVKSVGWVEGKKIIVAGNRMMEKDLKS